MAKTLTPERAGVKLNNSKPTNKFVVRANVVFTSFHKELIIWDSTKSIESFLRSSNLSRHSKFLPSFPKVFMSTTYVLNI